VTRRTRGISLPRLIDVLAPYLLGWRGYFGFCQTPRVLTNLEAMDPPKATFVSLEAMAKRPQPLSGTAAPWRAEVQRGGCRRLADRVLAHVRTSGGRLLPLFRDFMHVLPFCVPGSLRKR
jgi:Group II intron, maturase-specific domain